MAVWRAQFPPVEYVRRGHRVQVDRGGRNGNREFNILGIGHSDLRRSVGVPVILDYLLSHLGFFTVLPVLPLLILRLSPDASPWFIGAALFSFNFAVRGASLFCSRLLHRVAVRRAMAAGLLMAAAGFALLPVAPGRLGIAACLVLAGTGISTNGLMARVYIAMSVPGAAERNAMFSAVQVAVNVAAALGPIVANVLLGRDFDTYLLLSVAAMYLLAAAAVAVLVPGGVRPDEGAVRPPLRLGLLRAIVADPAVRRVSAVTAVGGFLYAQFFTAIALHLAQVTHSVGWRASVFTANAVLVVVLQIPVSAYAARRITAGSSPLTLLLVGVGVFAAAFAVMTAGGAALPGVFAAVAVFSLAETLFTPMVNTAFSEIRGDRPVVEVFNLRQIAATVGESTGAFAGGALFGIATSYGVKSTYWAALAALGVLTVVAYRRRSAQKVLT
jgi:DHA1 family multidrug resistance protein-like MFS transporter